MREPTKGRATDFDALAREQVVNANQTKGPLRVEPVPDARTLSESETGGLPPELVALEAGAPLDRATLLACHEGGLLGR